jgi:DUF971 family protein
LDGAIYRKCQQWRYRTGTGLTMNNVPISITLHAKSKMLEVLFDDIPALTISFELMRVYSPSAEVQGHSPDQAVLQIGKSDVDITSIEPVGSYGIKPTFSDGHCSGIFTWTYLRKLGTEKSQLWENYQNKVAASCLDTNNTHATKKIKRC